MDFLLLIYSLSFLMLGAVSLGLSRLTGTVRLWQCLAFFGIAQGLYGIAEMLLECFNGADFIHWTHCAFTALSCFGLVQFGMPLGQKIGTHIISWSTYFPLVALAALGLIQGVEGLEYSLPFGFILPGGWLQRGDSDNWPSNTRPKGT